MSYDNNCTTESLLALGLPPPCAPGGRHRLRFHRGCLALVVRLDRHHPRRRRDHLRHYQRYLEEHEQAESDREPSSFWLLYNAECLHVVKPKTTLH
jgi:hypothetical protein